MSSVAATRWGTITPAMYAFGLLFVGKDQPIKPPAREQRRSKSLCVSWKKSSGRVVGFGERTTRALVLKQIRTIYTKRYHTHYVLLSQKKLDQGIHPQVSSQPPNTSLCLKRLGIHWPRSELAGNSHNVSTRMRYETGYGIHLRPDRPPGRTFHQ